MLVWISLPRASISSSETALCAQMCTSTIPFDPKQLMHLNHLNHLRRHPRFPSWTVFPLIRPKIPANNVFHKSESNGSFQFTLNWMNAGSPWNCAIKLQGVQFICDNTSFSESKKGFKKFFEKLFWEFFKRNCTVKLEEPQFINMRQHKFFRI